MFYLFIVLPYVAVPVVVGLLVAGIVQHINNKKGQ